MDFTINTVYVCDSSEEFYLSLSLSHLYLLLLSRRVPLLLSL